MSVLKLDEAELQSRRAFFEITDDVLARLAALRPFAETCTDEIVEAFYELILGHAGTRRFFAADDHLLGRVKRAQRDYFLGLFAGRCDLDYVQDRLRVGTAHERIGLEPKWYLGAYRRYLELTLDRLFAALPPAEAREAYRSILRLVHFDEALAIDVYISAHLETIERHQAAIRELSTPVIRVFDGVLLLPLVGAIDTRRAGQIMETVLTRVADEHARCLIIDIAGVPVVDTQVADSLLRTTAAVRLLGTETILTGITADVARTIVRLNVDVSTMHTRARLAQGIEFAQSILGRPTAALGR